jgi:branched-chain amino acid transport system ATP-binding protein
MREILKLIDVTKKFGELRAVDRVSLEVRKDSITGLIGPNGSGKSTLFNTIAGVYRPDEGSIFYKGERIDGLTVEQIYAKGLVKSFQDARLFLGMTVLENMLLPPKNQIGEKMRLAPFHHKWQDQEKMYTETVLRLSHKFQIRNVLSNLASEISGGQMKLLQIGRSLMSAPELVLLDEPTAGVTPRLAREIFELIESLRSEGGLTFFIIEHKLDLLFEYAETIYVMDIGKIIAKGSPNEILKNQRVIDAYLGG